MAKIARFKSVNSENIGRKFTKFVHYVARVLTFNLLKADLQLWYAFAYILEQSVDLYVPYATDNNSSCRTATKPRHSRTVRKCASSKRKLWKNLSRRLWDSSLRGKYRDSTHKFHRALNADQTAIEERLISSNNLGAFYRYVSNVFLITIRVLEQ